MSVNQGQAERLIQKAWETGGETAMAFAGMAQAQAILAVADAIRAAKPQSEPRERTYFVLATSEIDALFAYKQDLQFESRERAEEVYQELGRPVAQSIFRISVEVVQE